jgi:hypothetical protein
MKSVYKIGGMPQFVTPEQRTWLLAANAVQGKKIGNLNIPAVLEYRVKTTC